MRFFPRSKREGFVDRDWLIVFGRENRGCKESPGIGGLLQWAVGVPATLTEAVLVDPVGMAGLNGVHDLITSRRPLGDDVSVQLGGGKGFATNWTRAFEIAFHTILRSKPRTLPAALTIRVTMILTL